MTSDDEVKGCTCLLVILLGLFALVVFILAAAVKWALA